MINGWRQHFLETVKARISWLVDSPDGIVADVRTPLHRAVIAKRRGQIQLFFVNPDVRFSRFDLSGAMSRMALDRPLDLLAVYTQASMLALVWKPMPERICLLGLGGGRMAMVLHYYFPDTQIDCVEIDPAVVDISETYFGLSMDDTLSVTVQDAREYMETLPEYIRYDLIIVDCFTGAGHHPGPLATTEFYEICDSHLARGGVVVTNILESDPFFGRKADTFAAAFKHPYRFIHPEADVFFGSDENVFENAVIMKSACEIEKRHGFVFPFSVHAGNVHAMPGYISRDAGRILSDSVLPDLT